MVDASFIHRALVLAIGIMVYMCEGINVAILAPFFPPYAEDEVGLSETQIGLVVGAFDMANFCSQFLVASIVRPQQQKLFFTLGTFLSAGCVGLFGYCGNESRPTVFFVCCLSIRVMMGVGASFVFACTTPIVTRTFPEKAAFITSVAQSAIGAGAMIGPPLGSLMYQLGGYSWPFYLSAIIELVLAVAALLLVPELRPGDQVTSTRKVDNTTYFRFVSNPWLLALSVPILSVFAIIGYKDVAYSLFLRDELGMTEEDIGYTFIAIAGCFVLTAPLFGIGLQKGVAGYTLTLAMFLGCSSVALLAVPAIAPKTRSLLYVLPLFALTGVAIAALCGSCFFLFEKIAERNGFEDQAMNRLMVSSWYYTVRSVGRITGSFLVGGVVLQFAGFYRTCLIYGGVDLLLTLFAALVILRLGFFRLIYQTVQTEGTAAALVEKEGPDGQPVHSILQSISTASAC